MKLVVFACVQNAGRSQMAAAFFNDLADSSRVRAESAGTRPATRVHPVVAEAMHLTGIDLFDRKPQLLTEALLGRASLLVTMGCGEECPYMPGLETQAWSIDDPRDQPLVDVVRIRDEIRRHVQTLVKDRGWRIGRPDAL
jgi:arsenate reductase